MSAKTPPAVKPMSDNAVMVFPRFCLVLLIIVFLWFYSGLFVSNFLFVSVKKDCLSGDPKLSASFIHPVNDTAGRQMFRSSFKFSSSCQRRRQHGNALDGI